MLRSVAHLKRFPCWNAISRFHFVRCMNIFPLQTRDFAVISKTPPQSLNTALRQSVRLQANERMLVLFDRGSELSNLLAATYFQNETRPGARVLHFPTSQFQPTLDGCAQFTDSLKSVTEPTTIAVDIDTLPTEVTKFMLTSLLRPNDLCVCVQSGTFQHRFQEYRLRLGLFERHIKMIEHVHLGLIDPDQHQTYLDSLGFSPLEHGPIAHRMKNVLDAARHILVATSGMIPSSVAQLSNDQAIDIGARVLKATTPPIFDSDKPHENLAIQNATTDSAFDIIKPFMENSQSAQRITSSLDYQGGLEPALLNIGDFYQCFSGKDSFPADDQVLPTTMSVGGSFPVGEVFSEAANLQGVNGSLMLWGFPNFQRRVEVAPIPFRVFVQAGQIIGVDPHAPLAFRQSLALIREGEGGITLREFGIGLNSAMSRTRLVNDVTAFERQKGFHVSLGRKHTVFKKSAAIRADLSNMSSQSEPSSSPSNSSSKGKGGRGQRRYGRFHIDVFAAVEQIHADNQVLFRDGEFVL